MTEHLWLETPHRRDYLNLPGTVEELIRKSGGVQEGLCLVNAMHITASTFQLCAVSSNPCSRLLEQGRVEFRVRQAQ